MIEVTAVAVRGSLAFWGFALFAFMLGVGLSSMAHRWRSRHQCPRCDAWLMSAELPQKSDPLNCEDRR